MKKILIVEDEAAYLNLLSSSLREKGYLVIEAEDGKVGLSKAKTEKPDLIILDLIMPKMDGMTMLDLLRKEITGKNTKVIILTNLEPHDKIIETVISNNPVYYFVKSDIKLKSLVQKIEILLTE